MKLDKEANIFFYYLRNPENHPKIAVCLIVNKGEIARGIAICSPRDNFAKKVGRQKALKRAALALEKKENAKMMLRKEVHEVYRTVSSFGLGLTGQYKQTYNPELTFLEKDILEGRMVKKIGKWFPDHGAVKPTEDGYIDAQGREELLSHEMPYDVATVEVEEDVNSN
jgi:hypothetical protein